jgi:CDP-glucose 4,6-dehydratase
MKTTLWKGKTVLVTGHTGFKGSWLSLWLMRLGATVHGVALDPPTEPNLFTLLKLPSLLASDTRLDIREGEKLSQLLAKIKPEVVFHLAAQPLVQYSYEHPIETFAVNVMGTAMLLEALRFSSSVRAAVMVTTDKCYENHETMIPYSEKDRLGGLDPYSNSKACAELVISSYRASYFTSKRPLYLASARAGNVIGGGDWAAQRLIPDGLRAYLEKRPLCLRYPEARRPWQFVLESIQGYLLLAEHLLGPEGASFAEAFNFGPDLEDMQTVGEVAAKLCKQLQIPLLFSQQDQAHEASLLRLDSSKAKQRLHWFPRWNLEKALEETLAWYQCWLEGGDLQHFTWLQIERYTQSQSVLA